MSPRSGKVVAWLAAPTGRMLRGMLVALLVGNVIMWVPRLVG